MNESILNALMRLFAIVAGVDENGLSPRARSVVLNYLQLQLNQELATKYIQIFDFYLKNSNTKQKDKIKERKKLSLNSVKILAICNEINEELQQSEKIIVLLRLLEFIYQDKISEEEIEFVETVADVFNIPRDEFIDIYSFVIKDFKEIKFKEKLLVVSKNKPHENSKGYSYKYIYEKELNGQIQMLYLQSVNMILLQYKGDDILKLNNFNLISNQTYIFDIGSVLKGAKIHPVYYTEILSKFIEIQEKDKVYFIADNISYTFPNSDNGIKPFTIAEKSGRLVGIMGGSGVGKSTLLNILIGNIKIHSGKITINGYDLRHDNSILDGIIGFVPQDDLLIEELTVYQNLLFNAKLCFRNLEKPEKNKIIIKVLKDLDLWEIKDLKVGSPLNKFISGGQRKRLNIALELIREPSILFADEPTSGLSSSDSEIVMSLLKDLTYKGKLVFVNIHQPSSDIYKLFDKIIIIDKGGYPIFYGNPIDAVIYFRKENKIANAEDAICPVCGNINPEQVLELIENKVVNEFGKLTEKRKFAPEKWYSLYEAHVKENPVINEDFPRKEQPLPKIMFEKASNIQQFIIFSTRNIIRKITNLQYILINILEAPVLAFILAFFSKYIKGTPENPNKYIFAENVNLPSFMFMAVTVALFLGLTVSAEEIIKDRKILRREKFLSLSHWAYLNSKIVFLFFLSALQTFLFVVVSNYVLEIHGLTFKFWIILFSVAFWGNIVGLLLSSSLNSVVTIYISIPLILIPLLLFSGTVIDFTKLNNNFTSEKYTPVIGDIMVSRWAFEALMVTQYTDNLYEKNFFKIDQKLENATYYATTYYDKLEEIINFLVKNKDNKNKANLVEHRFIILNNEINKIEKLTGIECEAKVNISREMFDQNSANKLINYLYFNLKKKYNKIANNSRTERDNIINRLANKLKKGGIIELKQDNFNYKIEDFVTNKMELSNILEGKKELIRLYRPIYQISDSKIGRAQFYAAYKNIGNHRIKTIWFNTMFIWGFSLILYIFLVLGVFDTDKRRFRKQIKAK